MPVRLNFDGMSELRTALQNLPQDLADEAADIVSATAQDAKSAIQSGYPIGPTGNLHNRVTAANNAGRRAAAIAIVKSNAPHAWIFEHGTRRRSTAKGANRGSMPEAPESAQMIPKVIRLRARMVNQLIELVKRAGFVVES